MEHLGKTLSLYWLAPFAGLLVAIAVMPLTCPRWWEKNRNKAIISFLIALPVAVYLCIADYHYLLHTVIEYFSFIILLAALFVISGGIVLEGDIRATPGVNTAFLAVGCVLANVIGTTGASMLLIRPLLRTNSERRNVKHIPIFFIFLVSNMGGLLTPVGDPPLFLGYLRGVPFTWTLQLWPIWLTGVGLVLALFYALDVLAVRKETAANLIMDDSRVSPLRLRGTYNFIFLLGVIAAIVFAGILEQHQINPTPWRELIMILMAALSYRFTSAKLHEQNRFTFGPIVEVAVLFAGIFVTMVPALLILRERGGELGVGSPWQFFWLTGGLSSFLDNAPTYLTYLSLGLGVTETLQAGGQVLPVVMVGGQPISEALLTAISAGAVFMGANTYIGNGPNFMVKSIAEETGLKMPSFLGYMAYSGLILIPIFLVITLIFF